MVPPPRRRLQAARKLPPQIMVIVAVLALAFASALWSSLHSRAPSARAGQLPEPPVPEETPSPSEPVEAAFEAAKKGDLDGYLAQFVDPLHAQLLHTRTEKGDAYLRDYLSRLAAPLKGLAADLTRTREEGPGEMRVPIEFVYAHHNEVQSYVVARAERGWRIARVEGVRSAPTLIPYGTPIQQVK